MLMPFYGSALAADAEPPVNACPGPNLAPMVKDIPDRSQFPILVDSRSFDAGKQGVAEARDQVVLRRADQLMTTDILRYDPESKTVIMPGTVNYEDSVFYMSGSSAEYSFLTEKGHFTDVTYGLTGSSAKGSAVDVVIDSGNHSVLRQIQFTTCPGEEPEWILSADELQLNFETGVGVAKGAKLKFFDIPILYLPWMTFPIDDRRKSGFLYPVFSTANDNGVELNAPYYWNIAPNQDATITPRYFTRRGFMLTGEYRFITRRTDGSVNFDYLPTENDTGDTRYHYWLKHEFRMTSRWQSYVVVDRVSDDQYFQDFGTSLVVASRQYLRSLAGIKGSGRYWRFSIVADNFQVVDEAVTEFNEPYSRVPRIGFDVDMPLGHQGLRFQMGSELVNFNRDNGVTGTRFDIFPRVEWNIETNWGYVRPSAGYRFTIYDLNRHGLPGDTSPDRGTEILSFDTGMFLDRTSKKGNVQTLEPRLFYLYVPYVDQNDFPDFDTAPFTFGFSQLFHFNRFTGADRQSDANQVTFALTTRSISQKLGRELWSVSFGQIVYFQKQRVLSSSGEITDDSASPFIGEFIYRPTRRLKGRVAAQWDWQNSRLDVVVVGIQHTSNNGMRLGAEYRFRRDNLDQYDLRYYQPINERWRVLSRLNYSLKDSDLLAAQVGIEYDSCCWAVRIVAKRFLRNRDGDYRDAIYVQLALKGLANVGRSTAPLFYDLAD